MPVGTDTAARPSCAAGSGCGQAGKPAQGSSISGPVMSEYPRHPDRLVAWSPPQFLATGRVAGDLDMTAASRPCGLAVARFPGDGHGAGPPWVMAAALLRKAGPRWWLCLDHACIQTCDRCRLEVRCACGQIADSGDPVVNDRAPLSVRIVLGDSYGFQLAPAFTVLSSAMP
jgi:hypothetical protein